MVLLEKLLVPEPGVTQPNVAGPSILVVEDELHLRRLMQRLLERAGYRVRTASEGRAALALIAEETPDIILLDYKMPVLDGPGFLAEARKRGIDIPVVLVTASPEAQALKEQYACDGIVPKPFAGETLLTAVDHAFG